jgi:hypothetical protein
MDKPKKTEGSRQSQSYDTKREGYYWNEHIRSEVNAYDNFNYDQPKAEEFERVLSGCSRRIAPRGTGSLIALNNSDKTNRLLTAKVSNHFFSRSATSNQAYPSSLMGMMALLRQVNHDLKWYKMEILKIKICP